MGYFDHNYDYLLAIGVKLIIYMMMLNNRSRILFAVMVISLLDDFYT